MSTVEDIRRNGERLRELHARIHDTFSRHSGNMHGRTEWESACAEFHRYYQSLAYPGGFAAYDAVAQGDSASIEVAVSFLQADSWFFRSGYMKAYLWRHLKKHELSPSQRHRLEAAALGYLARRVQREFWAMANFMTIHGGDPFWSEVGKLSRASDE